MAVIKASRISDSIGPAPIDPLRRRGSYGPLPLMSNDS